MRGDHQLLGDASERTPSAARMYDFFLGGSHNFPADRQAAAALTTIYPEFPLLLRVNRAFLRRAVQFLLAEGIDQFLDLGSGIPTVGNVHEIAQSENPAVRVVYVDTDPIAVAHSELLLRGNANAAVIEADARSPEQLLRHPTVERLLDFGRPLAVLIIALLHFIPDDSAAQALVQQMVGALPSGGYVALSHATYEGLPADAVAGIERLYSRTANPTKTRSRAAVARFFAGLDLVPPGLVHVAAWRPEGPHDLFFDHPERSGSLGGVGRKS